MIYGKRGHKPVSSVCKNHKKTVILACELYQLCLNTLPVTVHPHPLPSVMQHRRATHKGHQVGTKIKQVLLVHLVRPDLITRPYPKVSGICKPRLIVCHQKCKNFCREKIYTFPCWFFEFSYPSPPVISLIFYHFLSFSKY